MGGRVKPAHDDLEKSRWLPLNFWKIFLSLQVAADGSAREA
jgi:hypothetical protein